MLPKINIVHVFRTNIHTEADALAVKDILDTHQHILQWSVDLGDVDRVLRIVTPSLQHTEIISLINQQGYQCAELE